jgi:hypothetical protein
MVRSILFDLPCGLRADAARAACIEAPWPETRKPGAALVHRCPTPLRDQHVFTDVSNEFFPALPR